METFIMYILKANIVISVLYGAYWLLLRNEKFFTVNRLILLSCIALSFLLPFLSAQTDFLPHNKMLPANPLTTIYNAFKETPVKHGYPINQEDGLNQNNIISANWVSVFQMAFGFYILVTFTLLVSFLWQLFMLRRFFKAHKKQKKGGISFLYHNEKLSPFSFFRHLVINKSEYKTAEFEQIIAHEYVHIKQLHTIDVLFAEIVGIVLWINPLAHMLKRSIKLNLEYLADEKVLKTGIDKQNYQLNILNHCLISGKYSLTNLFNSSKVKLRIKMMNSKNTPLKNLYMYLFLLPVIVAAYFAITPLSAQTTDRLSYRHENVYVVINSHTSKEILESIKNELRKWNIDLQTKNETFINGVLTSISIDVKVAGAFNKTVSSGGNTELLSKPVIFYYERKKGFNLSVGVNPQNLSKLGKNILIDNLNGLLLFHDDGDTIIIGSIVLNT